MMYDNNFRNIGTKAKRPDQLVVCRLPSSTTVLELYECDYFVFCSLVIHLLR